MSYQLILTEPERDAFDWVGGRYNAGTVAHLLRCNCPRHPETAEWSEPGDIAFTVPEHVAWQIHELAEQEDYLWPCFSPALTDKLNAFCFQIV